MAMRTTRISGISGGGARTQQPARTQSQNFRPKSEWKHEDSASFLFVFLPGFILEQLTITPDYSNGTVKVEGQRRLPNNRLLPVNETFNIPQDCDLAQMDKQFGRGILMLKMPRNTVPPPPQPQTTTTTKETQTQDQEAEETKATTPETSIPQQTLGDSTTTTNINEAVSTKLIDEKSAMTDAKSDEEKLVETKEENDNDGKPKPTETETPQHLVQNAGAKKEESKEQSKESAIHQAIATTHKAEEILEKETSEESADAKGRKTEKETEKEKAKGKETEKETEKEKANAPAKKCMVKGLNEDRKLVVNMGAAVLIIMGLGVSLFYTLRSSNSAG